MKITNELVRLNSLADFRINTPSSANIEEYNDGVWQVSGKMEFIYNQSNRVVLVTQYVQPMPTMLIPVMKMSVTYNTTNQPTLFQAEYNTNPVGTPTWVVAMKLYTYYNAQNHFDHMFSFAANDAMELVCNNRMYAIRNGEGIVTHMYSWEYYDESTEMATYYKETLNYQNEKLTGILSQSSSDSTTWVDEERQVWTYDPSDQSNYESWNAFLDNGNFGYIFIGNEYLGFRFTNRLIEHWVNSQWLQISRKVFTYDTAWNATSILEQNYYEGWVDYERMDYTFDESHNILTETEYNYDDVEPVAEQRTTYIYGTPISDQAVPVSVISLKNYPNPFNPETGISFNLPYDSKIKLSVYNTKGQLVKVLKEVFLNSGNHVVNWNGTDSKGNNAASGMYFYKLETDRESVMSKMLLIK
jgi:hypothetical protein